MNKLANLEELNVVREEALAEIQAQKCRILICAGTGCLAVAL